MKTATELAQKIADQELEACCEWLRYELRHQGQSLQWSDDLRADRRPEPSLKEQALLKTTAILDDPSRALLDEVREALELNRRALEQLDD